jgi:uncharacterized damage-inducible protein DinB
VADLKPPRLSGSGERATLRALTQYHRESIVRKLDGISEEAARREFVGSGTTLLFLVKHLTRAEILWIGRRFAGRDLPVPDDSIVDEDTIDSVVRAYRAAWALADSISDHASLDQTFQDVGTATMVDLRWVLTHILEETARHAGHADILRELVDGTTGR